MEDQGVGITITQHILNQQRENPDATGAFTILLNELIVAAKVISREVNPSTNTLVKVIVTGEVPLA